jgi:LAO/AO transport system kinase
MNRNKPDWVPDVHNEKFTTSVMQGITDEQEENFKKKSKKLFQRKRIDTEEYINGILNKDIVMLSRAITLIESNSKKHIAVAQEVIKKILPNSGNSVRIGITGPPGAGKSTFIESLGLFLCNSGLNVAVLAVDPSSSISKGSVLGDKTRMEMLSRHPNSYIRPSASGGTLGGVTRKTRETILACEAAGFEVILIETIGVGQSEITVRSMVDFFMLLLIPGSGDELQGIKKGVVEIADAIVINKAEGNNKSKAEITKREYQNALQLLNNATEGWNTKVRLCSALKNIGIEEIWTMLNEFIINTKSSGIFSERRKKQTINWMYSMLEEAILSKFYGNPTIKSKIKHFEEEVLNANVTPTQAVNKIMQFYSST